MNWLKRILTAFGALIAALCLFILLCAIKPELALRAGELFGGSPEAAAPDRALEETAAGQEAAAAEESAKSSQETADMDGDETDIEQEADGAGAGESETLLVQPDAQEALYEKPKDRPEEIPPKVLGRNGYMPVEESGRQVAADEARRLRDQVGYGETGDGLTFDALYYPYYAMLNETGQALYRQIYANAQALTERFAPTQRVTRSALKNVFMAVYNDHPELFWLETGYVCKYLQNGECVEIQLAYNDTAKDLATASGRFQQTVENILSQASGLADDYAKEQYVHNALMNLVEYNLRAPMNQSAYSALVNGQTVCAGYARAFQYLLQQLGIPCYYCTGYAGENHAWNIVKLGEDYYNVDVTWDDTQPPTYDYFNKTDRDYDRTHMRQDLSVYLPACEGEAYRTPAAVAGAEVDKTAAALPRLADYGLSEADVLHSLDAYYQNCYQQAMAAEGRNLHFTNVIQGEDLWQAWQEVYEGNDYQDGFATRVMQEKGAASGRIQVRAQELQDGCYLLEHTFTLQ